MEPANIEPVRIHPLLHRFGPPLLRLAGGVIVLLLLGRQVGTGPFRDGLHAITWPAIVAAFALTAMTTVCSAWRWRVVAQALGVGLTLRSAVGAYYRSQFLNSVLPGEVLGDVHRAVAHGRHAGGLGRGLRAVTWERLSGQVVQAVVTAIVLLTLPSPVHPALPYLPAGVAGAAGCAALAVCVAARRGRSRPTLAARVAGSTPPLGELVAFLMLVQTAMVIPLNVGGWGPREGAAAWAFAAAGLGAAAGVTVTTLYAVIALVALAPGAVLLLHDVIRRVRGRRSAIVGESPRREVARPVGKELEAIRG